MLAGLFALALVVGAAGLWFHSDGHVMKVAHDALRIWSVPLGKDGGVKMGSAPPALAPLAFCGLGLLGLVVCAPRSPPA